MGNIATCLHGGSGEPVDNATAATQYASEADGGSSPANGILRPTNSSGPTGVLEPISSGSLASSLLASSWAQATDHLVSSTGAPAGYFNKNPDSAAITCNTQPNGPAPAAVSRTLSHLRLHPSGSASLNPSNTAPSTNPTASGDETDIRDPSSVCLALSHPHMLSACRLSVPSASSVGDAGSSGQASLHTGPLPPSTCTSLSGSPAKTASHLHAGAGYGSLPVVLPPCIEPAGEGTHQSGDSMACQQPHSHAAMQHHSDSHAQPCSRGRSYSQTQTHLHFSQSVYYSSLGPRTSSLTLNQRIASYSHPASTLHGPHGANGLSKSHSIATPAEHARAHGSGSGGFACAPPPSPPHVAHRTASFSPRSPVCAATRPVSANSGPQASPKCRRGLGKMLSQSAGRAATMVQLQQQLLAAEALGQQQARAYKALLESRRSHESPSSPALRHPRTAAMLGYVNAHKEATSGSLSGSPHHKDGGSSPSSSSFRRSTMGTEHHPVAPSPFGPTSLRRASASVTFAAEPSLSRAHLASSPSMRFTRAHAQSNVWPEESPAAAAGHGCCPAEPHAYAHVRQAPAADPAAPEHSHPALHTTSSARHSTSAFTSAASAAGSHSDRPASGHSWGLARVRTDGRGSTGHGLMLHTFPEVPADGSAAYECQGPISACQPVTNTSTSTLAGLGPVAMHGPPSAPGRVSPDHAALTSHLMEPEEDAPAGAEVRGGGAGKREDLHTGWLEGEGGVRRGLDGVAAAGCRN